MDSAFRHGRGSATGEPVFCRSAARISYSGGDRQSKMVLAELGQAATAPASIVSKTLPSQL